MCRVLNNFGSGGLVSWRRWLTLIHIPKGQISREVWGSITPDFWKLEALKCYLMHSLGFVSLKKSFFGKGHGMSWILIFILYCHCNWKCTCTPHPDPIPMFSYSLDCPETKRIKVQPHSKKTDSFFFNYFTKSMWPRNQSTFTVAVFLAGSWHLMITLCVCMYMYHLV